MKRFVSSLRIFLSSSWLSYISLFAWTSPQAYLACVILAPIGQMLFFVLLGISATGKASADFYIIGNAIQMAAINGIYGVTFVIGGERNSGTLIYLLGSPANRLSIFLGRTVFNILNGIFTVIVGLALGLLLGLDLSHTNLLSLFVTILISTFSACGFGLLLGSLSLLSVNVMFLNNTIYFLLLLFSGANLPIDKMPSWVQTIGSYLPLSRGIQSARLLVSGAYLADVWPLLFGEIAIGTLYAFLGLALFKSLELLARHKGSLEYV